MKVPILIDAVDLSRKRCTEPIVCDLKYATTENFVGRVIEGYHPDVKNLALLSPKVAERLCFVQNSLVSNYNYGLIVFDAYRPRRAVLDFLHWCTQKEINEYEKIRQSIHYPKLDKSQLFELHYLMEDSRHCYGNTVDVMLLSLSNKQLIPMGAPFDYFDEISYTHADPSSIGEIAHRNRHILVNAMKQEGFVPAITEFWHYTHPDLKEIDEPLDIPIANFQKLPGEI